MLKNSDDINYKIDKLSAIGHSTSEHESLRLYENLLKNNYFSQTNHELSFEKQYLMVSSKT